MGLAKPCSNTWQTALICYQLLGMGPGAAEPTKQPEKGWARLSDPPHPAHTTHIQSSVLDHQHQTQNQFIYEKIRNLHLEENNKL